MFGKREIVWVSAVFLFCVCLISPPFPALRKKPRQTVHSFNSGSAQDYLERGNFYFYQGKYDLAIADYNQAIQIDSNYLHAYIALANVYPK
ncbi:MAG: tetratricopeptide repeat protein, partial [Cyanobacteria bacterium J06555_3]